MKKFDEYVAELDIKPVPIVTVRYAAYRNGEVKFFDNVKDAKAFSPLYERIQNQEEVDARNQALRHNTQQQAIAEKQFYEDLTKETKLNKVQMQAIVDFANNYDIPINSYDNQAEFIDDVASLIESINFLADKK
jgi:hypothetical protein